MMNHIWNRVYNFLNELRCEDKSESIVVQLKNCSKEKNNLASQIQVYQKTLQKVPDIERKIIIYDIGWSDESRNYF